MGTREPDRFFRYSSLDDLGEEGFDIIQSEAAAKPTGGGVQVRVREKLEGDSVALEYHPVGISPCFGEAELRVETRRGIEIARRKIWGRAVRHEGAMLLVREKDCLCRNGRLTSLEVSSDCGEVVNSQVDVCKWC